MDDPGQEVEILLVEDNPTDAELTIRALKKKNLANKLVWVQDGAQALDFIFATGAYAQRGQRSYPRVIILDLHLPKVDGMEVLTTIKADASLAHIPVVVLTTSAAEVDMAKAYGNHANSYLVKPVDFPQFLKLMDALGYYWLVWNQFPY